jgi:vanillate O-demethylase ferredoxin subunit
LITADDAPDRYVIGVKRDAAGRGGSRRLHDSARVGDLLKVGTPRNNFPLNEAASSSVLIAGGIGITPIRAMIRRLQTLNAEWQLHYSCRSREDAVFLSELTQSDRAHLHFDDEADGALLGLDAILVDAPRTAHLYCCGPSPMLAAFREKAADWPEDQIHVEYFAPAEEAATSGGLIVELARSKREIEVRAGETILDALRAAGIDVSYSCEQGICGACETRVLGGVPDHRDSILSDAERASNKTMMVCVSSALSSRLVLDL